MNYRKTILHVDDDPQLTRLVAQYLRPRGYEVSSLNDPAETLQLLGEQYHRLVLLDIDMPKVNGVDLLRQIKQAYGGSQIIMLTGQVSTQSLLQSYRWGAEYCIFKPLTSITPLLEAVEAVFAKIDHWWRALEEVTRQSRETERKSAWQLTAELSDMPDMSDCRPLAAAGAPNDMDSAGGQKCQIVVQQASWDYRR
jgi:DNA-binding response OmpR family regulator